MALGCDVLQDVESGYNTPYNPPTDIDENKWCNDYSIVFNSIIGGLTNHTSINLMHWKSEKEIWDKLKVIYEGDKKFKEAILQTYRNQFENFKMKEEENIVEYLQRVDEIVNSINALGKKSNTNHL